jgi:hypothetical protein
MSNNAFTPLSNTFALAVTAASQAVGPVVLSPAPSAAQAAILQNVDYRFTVVGTQPVWIAYAFPGATAPTAAIPASGASGQGFYIEGAISYTASFPYGTQFAVVAPAVGSSIYVTAGTGVAL